MARKKDVNWNIGEDNATFDGAQLAVLMDIRDELKELNRTLNCHRVVDGMDALARLDKRLKKHWPLTSKKRARR